MSLLRATNQAQPSVGVSDDLRLDHTLLIAAVSTVTAAGFLVAAAIDAMAVAR